jgi:hypothetical protein
MSVADEQLSYDYHIGFHKSLGHITGDPERDEHWHREAERLHALSVVDGILDLHLNAAILAQTLGNSAADFQLRFGVSRRTKFIWLSLRGLMSQVGPDRTDPLLVNEVEEAARDLNVIYINIRGVLDNLAWFLVEMFGTPSTRRLPPMKIALFGKEFLKDRNLVDVAALVAGFSDWNKELSSRRDPAAHRIPLSVPPAIIDRETRAEFDRAANAYSASFNEGVEAVSQGGDALEKFERTEVLFDQLQWVGRFYPVFVHHPYEGLIKIYPTVPQDVGQLVKITRGIFDLAKTKVRK